MRIIEERRLKDITNIINEYQNKSENIMSFYKNINKIKLESLQELYSEKNNEFFDDVSFVLDAITSIIAKPHISNKTEDIILRSDIAGHISNEAFQMCYKEPSLWKEKEYEMVPEYVHHFQYTDDIKIYENIFIGMLIDLIDIEVNTFLDMYESLIPSIDDTQELREDKTIEELIQYAKKLNRRLRYIKGTYFYKEVSKESLRGHVITPTNILTKDRLYNYCFKFYKKFIQYTDYEALLNDLKKYYLVLIIKNFKERKFVLDEETKELSDVYFNANDFKININIKGDYIKYTVEYKNIKSVTNIYIDLNEETKDLNLDGDFNYLLKIYNIKSLDNNHLVFHNPKLEQELIDYIIGESIKTYTGKKELYTTYCPVCKSKEIENKKNLYICTSCNSSYLFKDKNTIWFKKIRRL